MSDPAGLVVTRGANVLAREPGPFRGPYDWDAIMTRSFVLDQTDEAF